MRRIAARVALIAAVLGAGVFLFGRRPVEIEVVYDLSDRPPLRALDVTFLREGQEERRTEFRWSAPPQSRPRHTIRLRPGAYELRYRMVTVGGETITSTGVLTVEEGGGGSVVRP